GEAARITHNATGEGIYQAMQSGIYAADTIADVVTGRGSEKKMWSRYTWQCRQRFTAGFVVGHALRGAIRTPIFDALAMVYNSPSVKKVAMWALSTALAGTNLREAKKPAPPASATTTVPARDRASAAAN